MKSTKSKVLITLIFALIFLVIVSFAFYQVVFRSDSVSILPPDKMAEALAVIGWIETLSGSRTITGKVAEDGSLDINLNMLSTDDIEALNTIGVSPSDFVASRNAMLSDNYLTDFGSRVLHYLNLDIPDKSLFSDHDLTSSYLAQEVISEISLPVIIPTGEIINFPEYITNFVPAEIPSRITAQDIISDPIFTYNQRNLWAVLMFLEKSMFRESYRVPHVAIGRLNDSQGNLLSIQYIHRTYGNPDHVGTFHSVYSTRDDRIERIVANKIYWYGTVFFVEDKTGTVSSIGGWPSWL